MEFYTETVTFKVTKEQKKYLEKLKSEKVKVSKFIRDKVFKNTEKETVVKTKSYTLEDLNKSFENIFTELSH